MAAKKEQTHVVEGEVIDPMTGEVLGPATAPPASSALATVPQEERAPYHGIATVPTTPEELAVLLAPPAEADVDFRWADRDMTAALAYVSHIEYRRRLNKAFRPMGWGFRIVRSGIEGRTVVVHGALYIKGCFVAEAVGDHEYDETNENTSWGTAWESAKSEALVRCCKDLGMFSELWDKDYTEPLQEAWVLANRKSCPKCKKALRESKNKDGSWYCWAKMGGCGWQGMPEEKPAAAKPQPVRTDSQTFAGSAVREVAPTAPSPQAEVTVAQMYGEKGDRSQEHPDIAAVRPATPSQTTREKAAEKARGDKPTAGTMSLLAAMLKTLEEYDAAGPDGNNGRQHAVRIRARLAEQDKHGNQMRETEAAYQAAVKWVETEIERRKAAGEAPIDDLPF